MLKYVPPSESYLFTSKYLRFFYSSKIYHKSPLFLPIALLVTRSFSFKSTLFTVQTVHISVLSSVCVLIYSFSKFFVIQFLTFPDSELVSKMILIGLFWTLCDILFFYHCLNKSVGDNIFPSHIFFFLNHCSHLFF